MNDLRVGKVFRETGYPEHTYIRRREGHKEEELADYLFKETAAVSISGPSKTGKSALVKYVVEEVERVPSNHVPVRGNKVESKDDLWKIVLNKLDEPTKYTKETKEGERKTTSKKLAASIKAITGQYKKDDTEVEFETIIEEKNLGIDTVLELFQEERFVIFIDDAHKIPDDIHKDIAEEIKEAIDRDALICVGYIDYRGDALTSADSDLNSRVDTISLRQWSEDDLVQIANKGFDKLNIEVNDDFVETLAFEALESPQLMQKFCYHFCVSNDIYYKQEDEVDIYGSEQDAIKILKNAASSLNENYSTEFGLISGRTHGRSEDKFEFVDGTKGTRYDAILRGIAANEPSTSYSLNELKKKIRIGCAGKPPQSGNVTKHLKRMNKWVKQDEDVDDYIFDFVSNKEEQVQIPEPALLFYLRWSGVLNFEPGLRVDSLRNP
ncbi:hypothetical protein G9C85_08225 [Halorubellus sp. JP-L1]|uniref:hypothetical protein n=1 Tax=Halorubellus sp. JP-L1 TaxID=2715753 RepID=UPI00140CC2B1|nr:hypothetical protein [Halorubellus sp. JP-L1]NHN41621.1 hypothetical protein [Halorubellus sp. JP-L1]